MRRVFSLLLSRDAVFRQHCCVDNAQRNPSSKRCVSHISKGSNEEFGNPGPISQVSLLQVSFCAYSSASPGRAVGDHVTTKASCGVSHTELEFPTAEQLEQAFLSGQVLDQSGCIQHSFAGTLVQYYNKEYLYQYARDFFCPIVFVAGKQASDYAITIHLPYCGLVFARQEWDRCPRTKINSGLRQTTSQ